LPKQKLVKRVQQKPNILYASVATKTFSSSATQTELSMSKDIFFQKSQTPAASETTSQHKRTDVISTKPSSENRTSTESHSSGTQKKSLY